MRETSCCLFLTIIKLIDVIEAFNSTSRYLDVMLNIDYPNSSKWDLSITNGIVSSKIYDKWDYLILK